MVHTCGAVPHMIGKFHIVKLVLAATDVGIAMLRYYVALVA